MTDVAQSEKTRDPNKLRNVLLALPVGFAIWMGYALLFVVAIVGLAFLGSGVTYVISLGSVPFGIHDAAEALGYFFCGIRIFCCPLWNGRNRI
jgi:hypothetical protein